MQSWLTLARNAWQAKPTYSHHPPTRTTAHEFAVGCGNLVLDLVNFLLLRVGDKVEVRSAVAQLDAVALAVMMRIAARPATGAAGELWCGPSALGDGSARRGAFRRS